MFEDEWTEKYAFILRLKFKTHVSSVLSQKGQHEATGETKALHIVV